MPSQVSCKFLGLSQGFSSNAVPGTLTYLVDSTQSLSSGLNEKEVVNDLKGIAQALYSRSPIDWTSLSLEETQPLAVCSCKLAMQLTYQLQLNLEIPLYSGPKLVRNSETKYTLYLPSCNIFGGYTHAYFVACMKSLMVSDHSLGRDHASAVLIAEKNLVKAIKNIGVNTLPFIRNAMSMGIPCTPIYNRIIRYGWGAESVIMDSSITELTSAIGCNLAKDKFASKNILASLGLPVVPGSIASSKLQSLKIAQKIGSSVVLKPVSADKGFEVHVDLRDRDEIERAYDAITNQNHKCLVEKFYSGRDYRVHVFRGEVYRCIERIPGGVTGDGTSSIDTLINIQNSRRIASANKSERYAQIEYDQEATRILSRHGYDKDSVPAKGQFVTLRASANISRGGIIRDALTKAHPDNLDLAVRATEALGLDLAGVDLLIPDITKSWMEIGARICEVNAQPQISSDSGTHAYILNRLIKAQGRIPIDVVLGIASARDMVNFFEERLDCFEDANLGTIGEDGIFCGRNKVGNIDNGFFNATKSLLNSKRIKRLLICVRDVQVLNDGLAFDRFDHLIGLKGNEANNLKKDLQSDPEEKNASQPCSMIQYLKSMANEVYSEESFEEACLRIVAFYGI